MSEAVNILETHTVRSVNGSDIVRLSIANL